ncbi:MAG TPA: S53 family serine peptidase [Terracidiphilus sp.]|jgi:subtilase family serine protease
MQKLGASLLTFFVIASIANRVSCAESQPTLTHHVREATVNGQARFLNRLSSDKPMRLVLVLPLRNQAALDQFLEDLYNPASPSYRKYLTVEQFTARFGPTQQDYDAARRWAENNGFTIAGTSLNRLNLDVTGQVATVENALHVNMGLYQHPTENRTYYAPDREPTVDLPFRLWHIAGLDNYSIPHTALALRSLAVKSEATTGSCPEQSFCGSDMRAAYYDGAALNGSGQSLGLLEFAGTDLADLDTYYANIDQTNSVPITLLSTDGTSTSCTYPECDDTEQTIDMTQSLGMAPGLASLVMYVGSSDSAIFNAMATASPLNAQLSSSWTWYPADPSTDDPYFREFAAQGQNLFQAAGDGGAWSSDSEIYPADNVYLTSVGGTDLETSGPGGTWSSETAWEDGGGGISPDKFATPFWQTTTDSNCSECSNNYRNGPDVSANANFTFYVCADQSACTANLYGGTSFAAPMWAGYLALANQQAVANGQPTLGFINPALYDIGLGSNYDTDFNDITSGSNGYSATTGYDLATGWGSPKGSGLINGLLSTIGIPGFGLTASSTIVSSVQNSTGTSTISSTVINGFASHISLSATGQPAGVTVTFSPTSITGAGSSTMTIAVASSAAVGTYHLRVTGTSGSITEVVTITLAVTKAPPQYTITASPTSISVARGSSGTSTITTAISGGFDSAISLSATGYPIGVTLTFSPKTIAAPGAGKSTIKVTVDKKVALGSHTITINATGAGLPKVIQVTLDVLN